MLIDYIHLYRFPVKLQFEKQMLHWDKVSLLPGKFFVFQKSYLLSTWWKCGKHFELSFLKTAAAAKSLQSCPTLCDPIDGSPPSLGFSRQEHWSGLPFPSPMHESEKWKVKSESEVAQSCLTLHDPIDFSPPGSSVHGIFQGRVLEWGAIAFSAKKP